MQVHQFHPTVSYGDAISNQILSVQRLLRRKGYPSEIFCEQLPIQFEGRARQIQRYARYSSPNSVLLLHFSLGYSLEVMSWLRQVPDTKVILYHNITPEGYFAGINDVYLEAAKAGRRQLGQLSKLVEVAWGDSHFNCEELVEYGWSNPGLLPIIFDPKRYAVRPDREVLGQCRKGLNVLFVGRISPNKCLEDLILTFHYLKSLLRADARLLLVGSAKGLEPYLDFLQALVRRLGLSDVVFTGHVSDSELVAYYQCADVYLSMSEHEGFGVPFLESMYFDIPIIAYKAGAVPETLGGCGILVKEKHHRAVAGLIDLLADHSLRRQIVARQRERWKNFLPDEVGEHLQELILDLRG